MLFNMVKKESKTRAKKQDFGLKEEEMLKAGLHFGHRTSRLHPKMEPFIYGIKKTVHIIDLEKTLEKFQEALKFVQELAEDQKIMLLVGTKTPHKELAKNIARECDLPYVNERWLGGTLTNFEVMRKRIDYLNEIEEKKKTGEFEKYTKKEKIKIEQEFNKLKIKFEGIRDLKKLPDALFICDIKQDSLAAKEARMKNIPVIAIVDTNADPSLADYPIPANDDAISSVRYILEKVKEVISKAKPETKEK